MQIKNMKKNRFISACLAGMLFAGCTDGLYDTVTFNVSVDADENITVENNVITVKAGVPVDFRLSGNAEFVTFFSGEKGSEFANRNRLHYDVEDIASSSLGFTVTRVWGGSGKHELEVLVSDDFPGLTGDFETDSIAVEQFYAEGKWTLVENLGYEVLKANAAGMTVDYSLDDYIGTPVTVAIRYKQGLQTINGEEVAYGAAGYDFSGFGIFNTLADGTSVSMYSDALRFTPLNMLNRWDSEIFPDYLYDYPYYDSDGEYEIKDMDKDERAYATTRTGGFGIWRFVDETLQNGSFGIPSTNEPNKFPEIKDKPDRLYYSWLISEAVEFNLCDPDNGLNIKDYTTDLASYRHTYGKVGMYNAVFVARNVNMDACSERIKSLVINVVE